MPKHRTKCTIDNKHKGIFIHFFPYFYFWGKYEQPYLISSLFTIYFPTLRRVCSCILVHILVWLNKERFKNTGTLVIASFSTILVMHSSQMQDVAKHDTDHLSDTTCCESLQFTLHTKCAAPHPKLSKHQTFTAVKVQIY